MFRKLFLFFRKNKSPPKVRRNRPSSLEQMTVNVSQLQLGMRVIQLDRPWEGTPFLFQGFIIETDKEIQMLREYCNYVDIDVNKHIRDKKNGIVEEMSLNGAKKEGISHSYHHLIIGKSPAKRASFEGEIESAGTNYEEASVLISDAMARVADGQAVDIIQAEEAVTQCVDSVLQSPDAMLWLSQLKKAHKYTSQHSLNVSVLSIVLGRQIGLSFDELTKVGLCGLMHDMGKMLVPSYILNKPSILTPEEEEIMQRHPDLGFDLLSSSQNIHPDILLVVRDHHERVDGQGYSRRLGRGKLSFYTSIVTIADMYDAMTSDRVYQKKHTHLETLKVMMDLSDKHVDKELLIKFIQSLGVYPPGMFVEMTNGSIAMVLESDPPTKLRPKILLIRNENKEPLLERVIDLATLPKDSRGDVLTIKSTINASDYQIDNDFYYQHKMMEQRFK